jgi:hypothetical protein
LRASPGLLHLLDELLAFLALEGHLLGDLSVGDRVEMPQG